jgi:cobalamin-dependent methionine synthase I
VAAIVATIGERLDARISEMFGADAPYAMALDGLGSAAVEALAAAACDHFREVALAEGMRSTMPLSPGMTGWPIDVGQRQIFDVLDASQIGVQLTPSSQMIPRKSLSMVLGLGRDVAEGGRACDYCSLRETCRYQDHYADIQR